MKKCDTLLQGSHVTRERFALDLSRPNPPNHTCSKHELLNYSFFELSNCLLQLTLTTQIFFNSLSSWQMRSNVPKLARWLNILSITYSRERNIARSEKTNQYLYMKIRIMMNKLSCLFMCLLTCLCISKLLLYRLQNKAVMEMVHFAVINTCTPRWNPHSSNRTFPRKFPSGKSSMYILLKMPYFLNREYSNATHYDRESLVFGCFGYSRLMIKNTIRDSSLHATLKNLFWTLK